MTVPPLRGEDAPAVAADGEGAVVEPAASPVETGDFVAAPFDPPAFDPPAFDPPAFDPPAFTSEDLADPGVLADTGPTPYRPLSFVEVRVELPATSPILVLEEIDVPHRRLEIPIGAPEGIAIAWAASGRQTPRPLTHELFAAVLESYGVVVETVRITAVAGASYSGELLLSGPSGGRTLACRVSDAVALALRQRLIPPITAALGVLEEAGIPPASA